MGNFIEQSAEDIMLNSMANVFMPEALDPVGKEDDDIDNDGDVDKSDKYLHKRRKAVGKAIAAEKAKRTRKEELELHLRTKIGELAEKKFYKSEKATNSDEKEVTIEEKPVKNTVVINPDVQEGVFDFFNKNNQEKVRKGTYHQDPKAKKGTIFSNVSKRNQMLKQLQNQSFNPEGDLVEVVGDLRPRSKKSPVKTGGTPPRGFIGDYNSDYKRYRDY